MRRLALLLASILAHSLHAQNRPVDFAGDIEPIFAKRCSACHGTGQQMAGVRFDQPDGARNVIVPGKSAESKLMERVSSTRKGFAMPPVGEHLTDAQIGLLRAWI